MKDDERSMRQLLHLGERLRELCSDEAGMIIALSLIMTDPELYSADENIEDDRSDSFCM